MNASDDDYWVLVPVLRVVRGGGDGVGSWASSCGQ